MINEVDSPDISALTDHNGDFSVIKWHYPNGTKSQLISDTYFTPSYYSHDLNISWTVKAYTWSYTSLEPNDSGLTLCRDLSDKVISISYECDDSNNIRTSANLNLYVPPDDDFWYMNKEYSIKANKISYGNVSSQTNTVWQPLIYEIIENIVSKNPEDYSKVRAVAYHSLQQGNPFDDYIFTWSSFTRPLGYFLPVSGGYSYDSTTDTLTLQLQGLSYGLTAEAGNKIVTPIQSFNYYFDMPYNNSPTKIISYRITNSDTTSEEKYSAQLPAKETDLDNEKSQIRQRESEFYNTNSYLKKINGVIFGNVPIVSGNTESTAVGTSNVKSKSVNVPMNLSISGTDDMGQFENFGGFEILEIIYKLAMCEYDSVLNKFHIPLTGYALPSYDNERSSKGVVFPNGWEFESGVSVMDIAEKILADKYYEPKLYVDEDRNLCIQPYPTYPSTYKYGDFIPFRCIEPLVISEEITMDDSDFFTVTEVYGKNSEYYGVYDGSFDGFKTVLWNSETSLVGNMDSVWTSMIPKVQVISDDSIESDEECYYRAKYETWKSTRGHTKIVIKLRDNMIYNTISMCHAVGNFFIEYRLIQNKETIICILDKASLSDGIWTWELTPFWSYDSDYDFLDSGSYLRCKSEHFNEWIGVRWNNDRLADVNSTDESLELTLTSKQKNTLGCPILLGWELINGNILRLYITSLDIAISVVKVFAPSEINYSKLLGEAVNTNGTGDLPWGTECAYSVDDLTDGNHIYKIFDYHITQNGEYSFVLEAYSPFHESTRSSPHCINVTGVVTEDNHNPYITDERANKLTDEDNNRFTI